MSYYTNLKTFVAITVADFYVSVMGKAWLLIPGVNHVFITSQSRLMITNARRSSHSQSQSACTWNHTCLQEEVGYSVRYHTTFWTGFHRNQNYLLLFIYWFGSFVICKFRGTLTVAEAVTNVLYMCLLPKLISNPSPLVGIDVVIKMICYSFTLLESVHKIIKTKKNNSSNNQENKPSRYTTTNIQTYKKMLNEQIRTQNI